MQSLLDLRILVDKYAADIPELTLDSDEGGVQHDAPLAAEPGRRRNAESNVCGSLP